MARLDRDKLGEWLSAYLDGELTADQRGQVERFLHEDAEARRLLDDLRNTVNVVSAMPRHRAPESIAERVQTHAERAALLGDVDVGVSVERTRRSALPATLATAAVLTLLIGGLWFLTDDGGWARGPTDGIVALNVEQGSEGREAGERARETSGVTRLRRARRPARMADASLESVATTTGTGADLVATASLEQKLRAGFGLAVIHTHRFGNELVRLQVTVRSESERDAVVDRVTAYLRKHELAEVSQSDTGVASYARATEGLFYSGIPEQNFAEADERQVLVRASLGRIDGLMGELSGLEDRTERVALISGPLALQGLQRARQALQNMQVGAVATADFLDAQPAPGKSELEDAGSLLAESRSTTGGNPWNGLFKIVAPDAQLLADIGGDSSVWPGEAVDVLPTVDPPSSAGARIGGRRASAKRSANGNLVTLHRAAERDGERKDRVAEPPKALRSLVDRRLEAARSASQRSAREFQVPAMSSERQASKRRQRRGAAMPSTAPVTENPTGEAYLTLVIQVKLASAPPGRTRPRPASAAARRRPAPSDRDRAKQ